MKRKAGRERSPDQKRSARKRAGAEVVKSVRPKRAEASGFERRRLLHELDVHRLELEVQNRGLRENQELLEESRARYADLYERAPIGHLTLDGHGIIREINVAGAELLGRDQRLLREAPLRAVLAPASRRAFDVHLRTCFNRGQRSSVELDVGARAVDRRIIELVSAPRSSSDGDAGLAVVHSVMHDISDRKRNDAQREELLRCEHEARVVAETANRIKEDFLAVVSHELRAPLAPMMMWIKALRAGGAGDTLRARAIEAIDTCLKTQVAMIDDLVDAARGRHGKLRIDRRPMDLQASVGAAIEALAPSGAAKHVALALEVDAAPAWVLGDSTRLQQVAANLLSNAIKFTPEGGHVAISIRALDVSVELRVRDDGEGIAADRLEHIFEPFRQYDSSPARRHGGLGLGLSIVEQLIAQHDGQVIAESAGQGRGACFTVTLPRLADGAPPRGVSAEVRVLSGVRILVVEDQDDAREALAATLMIHGADVATAASAAEGRAALAQTRPDVIVSDVAMPGEDGYAFIEALRSQEKRDVTTDRVPAVALTAHVTERARGRALAAGFDVHVSKTAEMAQLVSTIEALARSARRPPDRPGQSGRRIS